MNRQDQIFEYAFGEMSAKDAQVFEASLLNDFEAQKEINELKALRNDFSLLTDIPEMQFSKERLRNAILDEGIQPKKRPTINWFQWLMAPTAVAALVALTFVVTRSGEFEDRSSYRGARLDRNGNPRTATISIGPSITEPIENPFTKKDVGSPVTTAINKAAASGVVLASGGSNEPAKRIRRAKRTTNQTLVATAVNPTRNGGASFDHARATQDAVVGTAALKSAPGAVAAVAAMTADIAAEDRTIIVIDKEQESGVGAVVATEVSISQDVVIGG